jgi:hypothetical protein
LRKTIVSLTSKEVDTLYLNAVLAVRGRLMTEPMVKLRVNFRVFKNIEQRIVLSFLFVNCNALMKRYRTCSAAFGLDLRPLIIL